MTNMTAARDAVPATTPRQMIRAEINVREFHRWMGSRRLQDPDHAMHCLLTECFGKPPPDGDGLAPKPFRLIIPRVGSTGTLYGYGPADADAMREAAQLYGDPAQCRILNLPTLAAKSMPAEWTAGKRLGFEIRIRPVVRRGRGAMNPSSERDVFQLEAEKYPGKEMPYNREEIYRNWLTQLMARQGGADLESATLQSFQRVRSFRHTHARHCEGPDALMQGNLTITDSAAFAQLLARGIGRHRAYGYGMLLLRPPRR